MVQMREELAVATKDFGAFRATTKSHVHAAASRVTQIGKRLNLLDTKLWDLRHGTHAELAGRADRLETRLQILEERLHAIDKANDRKETTDSRFQ